MESFFNSNSCRICLVENAAMEISEMSKDFQELTGFHVSPSDPQKICPMCAGNLVRLKQFINLCKITEEYLEKFRVKSFVTQDLIPTESVFIKNETSIGSGQIEVYQTVSNETYEQQIQVPGSFEMKKKYKKAPRPNHVACTVCHKIFKRDYLRKHMQYYHMQRQKYQCDICKKMVGIKGNLEKHIKAVHLGIKIIQKKKEQKDLQNNVNEVVYFEQPVPGNADEHYQNDENYEEHFQKYDEDQCDESNYFEEFVPETVEEPVLMKVEEPINFETPVPMKVKVRCEICHSEVNQSYLKKHMAYFHTNQQIHICKFCNREFNIKGNMTKHIEIVHLGINKYKTIKPGSKQKENEKSSKKVICANLPRRIITEEYLEKFRVESSEPENEKNVSKIDSQRIQFFGTVPNETNEKRIEEPSRLFE
uniref:CSON007067 protein n=1 Tax=Culicoides sonorensis TaxID=179676 RepID=A0A336M0S1_CULSO